jgi:hypothetical protein
VKQVSNEIIKIIDLIDRFFGIDALANFAVVVSIRFSNHEPRSFEIHRAQIYA